MTVRYRVELTPQERQRLETGTRGGVQRVRRLKRAQILLMADKGATDEAIHEALGVGTSTVFRTRRKFVEGGVEHALTETTRKGSRRKLGPQDEAILIALACSDPPAGRSRWTLQLLANQVVALTDIDSVSYETVRRRLLEAELKPWQKRMWCIPKVDAPFVAAMEDILDLYQEPPDPARPVVCFDETPVQLVGESRSPLPCQPGKPARIDSEYYRNGTANLFVFLNAAKAWREVKMTDRRNKTEFAYCMRDLVDTHFPNAEVIRVVLDNLNTHIPASLYHTFEPAEARRILRRIEFHYTPKHASWLNMAEIEIGVLARQCLDRRIPDKPTLLRETRAYVLARNAAYATVNWLFSVDKARNKLRRAYPPLSL